jgi:hypothetical protein
MTSQPQYHLEMHWILDEGCLRLVSTRRPPESLNVDLSQPALGQTGRQAA